MDDVAQKLQAVRQNFLDGLPGRLGDIESLYNDGCIKQRDFHALEEFHRLVHSLTGTAGTFGEQVLSKKARELEIYLKNLIADSETEETAFDDMDFALIEKHLVEIASLIHGNEAGNQPPQGSAPPPITD